jgi:di/tripeptidase
MSETLVPFLLPAHIEWAARKFDDAIDFKELVKNKLAGALLEGADYGAALITLKLLNAKVSQLEVLDPYKEELHVALNDVIDGDGKYTVAIDSALDILDEIVDQYVGNDTAESILKTIIELLRIGLLSVID